MARQIRPGQLQENVLYNISASFAISASHEITHELSSSYAETSSFAITASHALNTTIIPAGTVSGSDQITALGFVTSSATASFVNNSATASFVTNSQTASMSVLSSSFALSGTGTFSGSFVGDGSSLINIPASGITGLNLSRIASGSVTASISPDNGFEVNTNITASGNISASGTIVASNLSGTNTGDQDLSSFITNSQTASMSVESASFAVTASHLLNNPPAFPFTGSANISGSLIVHGAFIPQGVAGDSAVVIGKDAAASGNGISIGKNTTGNPQGVSIGVSSVSGQEGVSIGYESGYNLTTGRNINIGTYAQGRGTNSIMLKTTTGFANTNNDPYSFGVFMTSNSIPDFQVIGNGGTSTLNSNLDITGSLVASGSVSASAFIGDGSQLTGIDPFPFTGDAVITGSLTITGSFHSFKLDSDNIVLGEGAGGSMIATADNNVILGTEAAGETAYNFSGDGNVAIGHQAGFKLSTGGDNILIGLEAGKLLDNDSSNVFIGSHAGKYQKVVGTSIGLGYNALQGGNAAGSTSTGNIAIGYRAGEVVNGALYNNMMGFLAGVALSTGDYNTLIGYYAGSTITSGNGNIIIGSGSTGEAAMSNQLRIGHANTIIISGSLDTGDVIFAGNTLLHGGTLSIKNQGAQSEARFYCEVNNAHYTALKAQPHALFSGNPVVLLPAYDLDFSKPNFQAHITASGNVSSSAISTASFGTYLGDGSQLSGISTTPFPFSGSAIITGSLTVSQSVVDFTSASAVLLNIEDIPLVNPIVEYVDVTAITSSGTTVTLPNSLTYVSSSVYEYLEIFINGLRLRYNHDFIPMSNTSIKYQLSIPSGSEVTYKSLKRP